MVDGEYITKYTNRAYDFSVLGATPITFPIEWNKSKIPGYAIRASMPEFHGFSALVVMSSVAARFFTPQIGGVGSVPAAVRRHSASITMRNSTRHPIFNISHGREGHGLDSTGGMTAAWWLDRSLAREAIARMDRWGVTRWWTLPSSVPTSNSRPGFSAVDLRYADHADQPQFALRRFPIRL